MSNNTKKLNVSKPIQVTPFVSDPHMRNPKGQAEILLDSELGTDANLENAVFGENKVRTKEEAESEANAEPKSSSEGHNTFLIGIFVLIVIVLIAIIVWMVMRSSADKTAEEEEIKRMLRPAQLNNLPHVRNNMPPMPHMQQQSMQQPMQQQSMQPPMHYPTAPVAAQQPMTVHYIHEKAPEYPNVTSTIDQINNLRQITDQQAQLQQTMNTINASFGLKPQSNVTTNVDSQVSGNEGSKGGNQVHNNLEDKAVSDTSSNGEETLINFSSYDSDQDETPVKKVRFTQSDVDDVIQKTTSLLNQNNTGELPTLDDM